MQIVMQKMPGASDKKWEEKLIILPAGKGQELNLDTDGDGKVKVVSVL
jgi:hypothetical protein